MDSVERVSEYVCFRQTIPVTDGAQALATLQYHSNCMVHDSIGYSSVLTSQQLSIGCTGSHRIHCFYLNSNPLVVVITVSVNVNSLLSNVVWFISSDKYKTFSTWAQNVFVSIS